MQTQRIALFSNITGGGLSLASVVLPWLVVGQDSQYLILTLPLVGFVLPLILLGGIGSLYSRYGGLITILGVVIYQIFAPYPGLSIYPVEFSYGPGFWMAWIGGLIALLGLSSSRAQIRGEFPKLVKWALPPTGTLLVVLGGLELYSSLSGAFRIGLLAAWTTFPIAGLLIALVGMTQGSILLDHRPQLGK